MAASVLSSGGACLMQSMHCCGLPTGRMAKPAGRAMAQVVQRSVLAAKRPMQLLQTGAVGQLRHTAHWLGMSWVVDWNKRLNTRSIYSVRNPPI